MAASERWIVSDDHRLSVGQMAATTRRCHYDVLGVERSATDDDIKKAYRKVWLV